MHRGRAVVLTLQGWPSVEFFDRICLNLLESCNFALFLLSFARAHVRYLPLIEVFLVSFPATLPVDHNSEIREDERVLTPLAGWLASREHAKTRHRINRQNERNPYFSAQRRSAS
jgi:hypothetical protein